MSRDVDERTGAVAGACDHAKQAQRTFALKDMEPTGVELT